MNRITKYVNGLGRATRTIILALAFIFVSAGIAQATTTISTNISTAGTLSVTGLATFLGGATTTQITLLSGDTIKNATASSTTISGSLTTTGGITGTTGTFSGAVSVQEFTQGGGQCTITDANGGAYVLTQAELSACNYLYMTASGAGQAVIALTLPATSTMTTLLANVGDTREWLIDASDLAAATTTTITKGVGIDMIAVTTDEDLIDGGEYSRLSCWRKSDTDVACITSELLNSD